jgi:galactokinase
LLTDENLKKRALHVISENIRTMQAVQKFKNNDLQALGKLLNQSNLSLKDNYEVTGFELDTIQEIAVVQKGVLGSRMTGAGFGGCNITLIRSDCINDFIKIVKTEYSQKTGLNPEFIIMQSDDGARKIL